MHMDMCAYVPTINVNVKSDNNLLGTIFWFTDSRFNQLILCILRKLWRWQEIIGEYMRGSLARVMTSRSEEIKVNLEGREQVSNLVSQELSSRSVA